MRLDAWLRACGAGIALRAGLDQRLQTDTLVATESRPPNIDRRDRAPYPNPTTHDLVSGPDGNLKRVLRLLAATCSDLPGAGPPR